MAETVHLFLKANGADIHGESAQTSLGREGSIECFAYEHAVSTAREAGSGMATGRRQHQPLLVRKPIDRASPLIMKALSENQVIEATFRFYRPDPSGDGTTQHFFTVGIKQARVTGIKQFVPDVLDPAAAGEPPQEEVTFTFASIQWTHETEGITHQEVVGRQ
jgi:type VI secretion system secreted protein Hcp